MITRLRRLSCALLAAASAASPVTLAKSEALVAPAAAVAASMAALTSSLTMTPALRIQHLAAELALSVEHDTVDLDKLRRTAEQLRAAARAYLMELGEAERPSASSIPEGRKAAQPIIPRPVGQPKSGGAPPADSAELQAKQEALDGTHLAPSPEEMRARIGGTGVSAGSPRDLIGQLTSELDELDRLLSSPTTATTPSLRATATHIQELAAKLR